MADAGHVGCACVVARRRQVMTMPVHPLRIRAWACLFATVLLIGCARHDPQEVFIGQSWDEASAILAANGYRDGLAKYELEAGFAARGGRIRLYRGLGGKELTIATVRQHGVDVVESIQDGTSDLEDRIDSYGVIRFAFPAR